MSNPIPCRACYERKAKVIGPKGYMTRSIFCTQKCAALWALNMSEGWVYCQKHKQWADGCYDCALEG